MGKDHEKMVDKLLDTTKQEEEEEEGDDMLEDASEVALNKIVLGEKITAIEFHDVSFSYPSRPGICVLEQVSFDLQHHGITALVGRSGSGKVDDRFDNYLL